MTVRKQIYMHFSEQPLLDWIPRVYDLAPELEVAGSTGNDPNNQRASQVSWILPEGEANTTLFEDLFNLSLEASQRANWNFDVGILEPLQYTHYGPDEKYDWHVDQLINDESSETCRKISFTMLLNDEFEGGDLQIECGSPANKDRAQSIPLQKGDIVFFPSYIWHRVLPVTKGERHSLVGWLQGPTWR